MAESASASSNSTMTSVSVPLNDLVSSRLYHVSHDTYNHLSGRIERACEWVDQSFSSIAESITLADLQTLSVLSVGPGDGVIDYRIWNHLLKVYPSINATIIEPDPHMMQQYKACMSRESAKLHGVHFEYRQETYEEYEKTSKEDDKFHLISCINSIYYLGVLDDSMKSLYSKLHKGALLLIIMLSGERGYGNFFTYVGTNINTRKTYHTSSDVKEVCQKYDIPIADIQKIQIRCDITACFAPPQKMSKEGKILLDFLTHTEDFVDKASPEIQENTLGYLRGESCSETGQGGEVILIGDNSAIIIRCPLQDS